MTKSAKEKNIAKNLISLILLVYGVLMQLKGISTLFGGTIEDGLFFVVYCVEGFVMVLIGLVLKYIVIFKK